MRIRRVGILLLLMALALSLSAQDNSMTFASVANSKFVNMPGIPDCMTLAVVRGDPTKGPAVILMKAKAGCMIPWHWHTAGESLIIISGSGKAEMKDGQPMTVKTGDYAYLPGKSIHQFGASSAVTMYDITDGAFDIHYVDKNGTEIPASAALQHMIKVKPTAGPTTTVPQ